MPPPISTPMPHMQRAARRGRGEAASGCGGWGRAPRKPPQPPAPPATPNHRWRRAQQLQKPQTGGRAVAPGSFLYNVKDGYQGSFSTHRDFCLPFLGLVYRGWGGYSGSAARLTTPPSPTRPPLQSTRRTWVGESNGARQIFYNAPRELIEHESDLHPYQLETHTRTCDTPLTLSVGHCGDAGWKPPAPQGDTSRKTNGTPRA